MTRVMSILVVWKTANGLSLILKTKQRHRKGHIVRTHNNYLGTGFLADIID